MGTTSISPLIREFLNLKGAKLEKDGWEIRSGDQQSPIIMVHSMDYHADTLVLTIDDIEKLLEPLGFMLQAKESGDG